MSDQPKNGGNAAHLKKVFAYINQHLPSIKKQKAKLATKAFVDGVTRKANEPVPCPICGLVFNPFAGEFKPKHTYCEACRKSLEDGYTALVTIDGKRFAFTRFPQASEEQRAAVAGKVMSVTGAQMDMIEKGKNEKN